MQKQDLVYSHAVHEIEPVFDSQSRILILGSFPSVKSREGHFFYNHPQNRFWKVISFITAETLPQTIEEKKSLLLKHNIALWDVISSCDISGSSDASIKNVIPNDISSILKAAPIEHIYSNGTASYNLYNKYIFKTTGIESVKLPSTSPANAAYSLDMLINAWDNIL